MIAQASSAHQFGLCLAPAPTRGWPQRKNIDPRWGKRNRSQFLCYNPIMTRIRFASVLLVFICLPAHATTLTKPIFAEVFLKGGSGSVSGNVTQWDDTGFTIHVGADDRTLGWRDLSAASAYTLRSRLIDRNSRRRLAEPRPARLGDGRQRPGPDRANDGGADGPDA